MMHVMACLFFSQAANEPAYLTVGTEVSAKYRGAFCEAKIKTVKRMVKVKVRAPHNNGSTPNGSLLPFLVHYF